MASLSMVLRKQKNRLTECSSRENLALFSFYYRPPEM